MLTDNLLLLSGSVSGVDNTYTGQALTSVATTVLSTNAIDLASGGVPASQIRDLGEGDELFMHISTIIAVSGGTSMQFQLIASDNANGTGNVTVIADTGAIPVAQLTLGSRFSASVNPRVGKLGQRYLTAQAISVGTTTTGTHVIYLGSAVADGQKYYPSGFAIL